MVDPVNTAVKPHAYERICTITSSYAYRRKQGSEVRVTCIEDFGLRVPYIWDHVVCVLRVHVLYTVGRSTNEKIDIEYSVTHLRKYSHNINTNIRYLRENSRVGTSY